MTDDNRNIRIAIRDLLHGQTLGVLATQGPEAPHTSLVAFSAAGLSEIHFATDRNTRKFANLSAQPRVALLVDSRANTPDDFQHAQAVTCIGTAEEVLDSDRERVAALYLACYPHLEDFVASPACALLRIAVERYVLVTQFQQVHELQIGD